MPGITIAESASMISLAATDLVVTASITPSSLTRMLPRSITSPASFATTTVALVMASVIPPLRDRVR